MSKYNKLLKKVELFEKLAVYGDRSSFLKAIAQGVSYPGDIKDMWGQDPNENVQTLPEMTIVGTPPIPRDVQEMLSRIVTVEGEGLPLKIDGELGTETRKAMNAFKKKFPESAKLNDRQLFDAIKEKYNSDPGKYGTLSSSQPAQKTPAPTPPKRNPGDPLPPMGSGLQGVVTNTKATGIGEHAGNVPRPNVTPKT